jgi:hypothetical protein
MPAIPELQALYPHLDETAVASVAETLRRYVELAVAVAAPSRLLTDTESGGTLETGAVDPNTFTSTTG